jgi:hypothetical protein
MLIRILTVSVCGLILLAGCKQSVDSKLVGTWDTRSMDAAWRVTFKSDHTLTLAFEDFDSHKFEPEIPGTWRLEGSQLTAEVDLKPVLTLMGTPHEKRNSQKMTETVTFVGNDKIERTGGYPYIRVK